mgnify:CR=1 FL=1
MRTIQVPYMLSVTTIIQVILSMNMSSNRKLDSFLLRCDNCNSYSCNVKLQFQWIIHYHSL